jgi:hypothetical protein
VPAKLTLCGLPEALSLICSAALLAPGADGVNVTEIVQLAFASNVAGLLGQLDHCAKSPAFVPVKPMLFTVSGAFPELVKVTVCAPLVPPTIVLANVKPLGESVTAGAGVAPPALKAFRIFAVVLWIPALT